MKLINTNIVFGFDKTDCDGKTWEELCHELTEDLNQKLLERSKGKKPLLNFAGSLTIVYVEE